MCVFLCLCLFFLTRMVGCGVEEAAFSAVRDCQCMEEDKVEDVWGAAIHFDF